MDTRLLRVVGAVLLVGVVVGVGVVYSLGLSNRGLAGAYTTGDTSAPMTFRGSYLDGGFYRAGDLVTFDGSAFVAINETDDVPPGDAWMLLAAAGPVGQQGAQGAQGPKGDKGDPGPSVAAWSAGYEIVQANLTLNYGTLGGTFATCPGSKRVISGGWYQAGKSSYTSYVKVMPVSAGIGGYLTGPNAGVGSSYTAVFWNTDAIPASLTVYAICVNA